jgi:enamine deaminase RidA (YjgF/YER057c/UK114 family)
MSIVTEVRELRSPAATELYVSVWPREAAPVEAQAREVFQAARQVLEAAGARILQERVFGTEAALAAALPIRLLTYGKLDDGVAPAKLVVGEGVCGALAGVQLHALSSRQPLDIRRLGAPPCGRLLSYPKRGFVYVSGVSALQAGGASKQAESAFQKTTAILRQAGTDFRSVVRTWMWLGDILSWYDDFNALRTRFLGAQGLVDSHAGRCQLPASTGIGVGSADGGLCAMDALAVTGNHEPVEFLLAGGNQGSAFAYGSAFSRAATAVSPAGKTVFVSGTAAVSADGATTHVGDMRGQLKDTIENVRAVLRQAGAAENDIVQGTAYCKTREVEEAFRKDFADLNWPLTLVVAELCRADLYFEVEVTACPGARRAGPGRLRPRGRPGRLRPRKAIRPTASPA